jgi:hypothetical protein
MTDPLQLITVSKNALDTVKLLFGYAEEVKDIQKRGELMRVIGELSLQVAEAQLKLAAVTSENSALKEEIGSLNQEIEALKNPEIQLVFEYGAYYLPDDSWPFCPGCYDQNRKRIRLISGLGVGYLCPVCETKFPSGVRKRKPPSDDTPSNDT